MTQRIEPTFSTWLKEIEPFLQHSLKLNSLFEHFSKNWTFFLFRNNSKNWTHFLWLKELNPFLPLLLNELFFFFLNIVKELNFFEYDSKNWTLFFLLCDSKIFNTFFEYDSQSSFFIWFRELNMFRKCNSQNFIMFLKITKLFFENILKE